MARRPKPPERRVLREAEFEEQQPLLRLFVPQLRKDVQIVAETFRGKRFYVLQDPISLQYFRIGETGRSIVAQFDGAKRLGDIHTELREQFAEDAPGFDELSRFVFSLRNANLLVADADTEQFLKRVQKKKRQRALSTATNFLFIRIPLVDPDRFLTKTHPYVSWIFSWPVFFMGLAVVIAALVKVVLHAEELMKPVNAVLAPPNLPLLWVAFVLVKVCHELGHAYSAKHYGAQVHRMGILFLVFVPCFYVDVTPVWGFERKRPVAEEEGEVVVEGHQRQDAVSHGEGLADLAGQHGIHRKAVQQDIVELAVLLAEHQDQLTGAQAPQPQEDLAQVLPGWYLAGLVALALDGQGLLQHLVADQSHLHE